MSVTIDAVRQKDKALTFLKSQKAVFANYLLDEEPAFWQEKFDMAGPPVVFVFDRDGKIAAKFDTSDSEKPFTHADVEKVVRGLLVKRPE